MLVKLFLYCFVFQICVGTTSSVVGKTNANIGSKLICIDYIVT